MNLIDGLSKYFGEDPPQFYVTTATLFIFKVAYPAVMYTTCYSHFKFQNSKNQVPYMAIYTIFYVAFFSAIRHKEIRFLMPVIPFAILPIAELVTKNF
jgi:undecaprenyl pyrophosphate phosphatase UppP